MGTIALYIFFIALFWVLTPYLIYPMWQMVFPGKHKGYSYTESAPKVSVIFAAYNERSVIVEKIESIFTTNYPQEQVEVWIGSDLSDDGQDDIIRSLQSKYPNLHLHINAVRSGKSATINKLVELCDGEVIIATDANIIFNEKTIEELVRPIATGEYAAVAGNLSYDSNTIEGNTAKTEKVYLNLENKIRLAESNKYGFCLGMEGGLYSMHKSLWKPIPPNTFMEDFFQTVQLIQREKCIYYNPKAFGFEDVSTSLKEEFKRKTRISIGNFQNLNRFKALVLKNPFPFGTAFMMHKIMRWTTPHALIFLLLTIPFIPFGPGLLAFGLSILAIELLMYRGAGPLMYFCAMNVAMLKGFITYSKGVQSSVWQPTKRNQDES